MRGGDEGVKCSHVWEVRWVVAVLSVASLLYVPECRLVYGEAAVAESMLCAGWEEGGRDSCQVRPRDKHFTDTVFYDFKQPNEQPPRGTPEGLSSVTASWLALSVGER